MERSAPSRKGEKTGRVCVCSPSLFLNGRGANPWSEVILPLEHSFAPRLLFFLSNARKRAGWGRRKIAKRKESGRVGVRERSDRVMMYSERMGRVGATRWVECADCLQSIVSVQAAGCGQGSVEHLGRTLSRPDCSARRRRAKRGKNKGFATRSVAHTELHIGAVFGLVRFCPNA